MKKVIFKRNAEESPKLISALNPFVKPTAEIKKIDDKLLELRIKFMDVKTGKSEMEKVRGEIDELLDKRFEWMGMRKKRVIKNK